MTETIHIQKHVNNPLNFLNILIDKGLLSTKIHRLMAIMAIDIQLVKVTMYLKRYY